LGLAADVGHALVGEPVVVTGEGLVDAVVEVLVVGEDDMATDVVELGALDFGGSIGRASTHEAFWRRISRGEATGRLVRVHDQP
jgi:hypothetical protein